jgi:hypothetical protein
MLLQFRRPDFKAEADLLTKDKDHARFGGFAVTKGKASYYAGGALSECAGT